MDSDCQHVRSFLIIFGRRLAGKHIFDEYAKRVQCSHRHVDSRRMLVVLDRANRLSAHTNLVGLFLLHHLDHRFAGVLGAGVLLLTYWSALLAPECRA